MRHQRTHLAEKPFACSRCAYRSSRRDKLKEHCARHHPETDDNDASSSTSPSRKPQRRAKKPTKLADGRMKTSGDVVMDEQSPMTEAVVNLVVSVPVLLSGRDLIAGDGSLVPNGPVSDGNGVQSLNGVELRVLDSARDSAALNSGMYRLLVGGTTTDCAAILLSEATDASLTSSVTTSSGVEGEAEISSSCAVNLPPPDSCSSLLLLGEVADGQLPATAVVQ